MVLTVDTPEIAVAKENIANPMRSSQKRLFAKMRTVRRDNRQTSRITASKLVPQPVVSAIMRAYCARLEH
jgi:hypothetical protein